jgi:peptidoglycan/xylan/chitin deacetylase (PgdA/CDA1 family)
LGFTSKLLNVEVKPSSYISDTCKYLELRWGPGHASPGTVVVPIMFHSIVKEGHTVTSNTDISAGQFVDFVTYARHLGYQTITTTQLVDFLYNNAPIPERSMILIVDDRRPGVIREHFMPFLDQYNWTVTLGYISGTVPDSEWKTMEDLASTGRLDVQAHGFLHNGQTYIQDTTKEEVIRSEIFNPIPVLEQHFGYRPTAFVWPGGDFNALAVKIAREAEYQVGFTAYSRGPLLFNWIPLGEDERQMNDPLMVLPRYWSTTAGYAIEQGAAIGKQARLFAEQDYPAEAEWYHSVCGGELPPLPTQNPQ